jgi:hypothetical protein
MSDENGIKQFFTFPISHLKQNNVMQITLFCFLLTQQKHSCGVLYRVPFFDIDLELINKFRGVSKSGNSCFTDTTAHCQNKVENEPIIVNKPFYKSKSINQL